MKATCCDPVAHSTPANATSEPLAVLAVRTACALDRAIERHVLACDQNLGHRETQAAHDAQEMLRATVERGAQAKADATPPLCPVCGKKLTRLSPGHARTFTSRFGAVTIHRPRGYCKACRKWRIPAAAALGLAETAGYSQAVQDMAALLASKMPVEDASAVLEHLTGLKLPRATLDREAKRQGERARRLRAHLDQQAATENTSSNSPWSPIKWSSNSTPGTFAGAMVGARARPCAVPARNPNAGTGSTPAPAFV